MPEEIKRKAPIFLRCKSNGRILGYTKFLAAKKAEYEPCDAKGNIVVDAPAIKTDEFNNPEGALEQTAKEVKEGLTAGPNVKSVPSIDGLKGHFNKKA